LQYDYAMKAANIEEKNVKLIYNETALNNETSFKWFKENILKNLDQEIAYEKKSLYYREQMVFYAPSELYKKYADIMVKIMKSYIQYLEVTREMILISQYPSENTNMTKRAELVKKQAEIINATNELIVERNDLIFDNTQLEKYINKLRNETTNGTQSSSGMNKYQNFNTNNLFG